MACFAAHSAMVLAASCSTTGPGGCRNVYVSGSFRSRASMKEEALSPSSQATSGRRRAPAGFPRQRMAFAYGSPGTSVVRKIAEDGRGPSPSMGHERSGRSSASVQRLRRCEVKNVSASRPTAIHGGCVPASRAGLDDWNSSPSSSHTWPQPGARGRMPASRAKLAEQIEGPVLALWMTPSGDFQVHAGTRSSPACISRDPLARRSSATTNASPVGHRRPTFGEDSNARF